MTSAHPLSPDFVGVLLSFNNRFQTSAERFRSLFLSADDSEEQFVRVCELVNTLDILSAAPEPTAALWELKGRSGRQPGRDVTRDAEDLLSVMLNAEFLLFDMYRDYDIRLNPPLAHWVGICRSFDKYSRKLAENADWTLWQRVLKMRAAFVNGILGENGPKLANITPEDFAKQGFNFSVDTRVFRGALYSQGIYDIYDDEDDEVDEDERGCQMSDGRIPYSANGRSASYSSASGFASGNPSPVYSAHESQELRQEINRLIWQAHAEELPPDTVKDIISYIRNNPDFLNTYPLDMLSPSIVLRLFATNQTLAHELIHQFLLYSRDKRRQTIINALQFIPITLPNLDMLNKLVQMTLLTEDETERLVHGVLTNGVRTAEAMAGGSTQFGSDTLVESYDRVPGSGGVTGRQAQAHHIGLLCLFIQSMLRNDVVDLQTLYLTIQEIGVKFMFVNEARELWRAYCLE